MSRLSSCRICGADEASLQSVLDLGETPLANRLLRAEQLEQEEPRYPLELVLCPRCSLLQITETVPPEILFREYLYCSSFSDTMLRHSQELAERLVAERELGPSNLVMEAASNDGYLLQYFTRQNVRVCGIEPARNIARAARARGIPTIDEFFGTELANRLRADGQRADVFHANNVLAHVADTNDFVRGIQIVLDPKGIAVIEAPYAKDMIDHCEFDTIYHEHLCYFSLTALERLFGQNDLRIFAVERVPIHGGSLRLFIGHANATSRGATVQALLDEEQSWGVNELAAYSDFRRRVETLKSELCDRLYVLKKQGARIAAYGASAKGSTLLNYFGIGRDTLEFVVDRSTVKQGHYTPGSHLPIHAPEKLLEEMPDQVLLLTWNFADEIVRQQREYRRRGGQFLIPIPELRVA
jgi:SAM-dependent methyltransferase